MTHATALFQEANGSADSAVPTHKRNYKEQKMSLLSTGQTWLWKHTTIWHTDTQSDCLEWNGLR